MHVTRYGERITIAEYRHRLIAMREVFRHAQSYLRMGWGSRYICHNIDRLDHQPMQARTDAKGLIFRALKNHATFDGWLHSRHFNYFGHDVQELRIQWLDKLCRDINIEIERCNQQPLL